MQLTQVLQSFVVPEENLNEDQVLMLDSLGKSVQNGQVINLTEEEIQQYTQFKRKLELFESNLSEDTLICINESNIEYYFKGYSKEETDKLTEAFKELKTRKDAIIFIDKVSAMIDMIEGNPNSKNFKLGLFLAEITEIGVGYIIAHHASNAVINALMKAGISGAVGFVTIFLTVMVAILALPIGRKLFLHDGIFKKDRNDALTVLKDCKYAAEAMLPKLK